MANVGIGSAPTANPRRVLMLATYKDVPSNSVLQG